MLSFFNKATFSVTFAAFILGSAALASRMLGLLRDRILAGLFGAGEELDIYFAAFRVPDLVYSIIIGGAISSAFIPVFVSYFTKNKKEAWHVARSLFYIALAALSVLGIVLFFLMPFVVSFIAPGFDEASKSSVVSMSRIMLLSPILLGLSAVFSGVLHSLRKFFVYSLAPIFYNIGIIIGALFLTPIFGISGLAWGVVLGAFLHLVIQVPVTFSSGFSLRPIGKIWHPAIPRILRLMLPRAFGLAAYQINLLVITAIASTLAVGSLSIFTLASNIQYLPVGIVGISFATAIFPSLSQSISHKEYKKYLDEFSRAFRTVLFLVLPLSALLFVLRAHIVRVVLGTGEFGWEDTRLTAAALGMFSFGIFAHALSPIISRAFYAQENTKTPVIANSIGIMVNIFLSLFLIYIVFPGEGLLKGIGEFLKVSDLENIAVLGLPLAFSVSGIIVLILLLAAFFRSKKNVLILRELTFSFARIGSASLVAGFAGWYMLKFFAPSTQAIIPQNETFALILIQALWVTFATISVYLIISYTLRFNELNVLLLSINRRLRNRFPQRGPTHPDQNNGAS